MVQAETATAHHSNIRNEIVEQVAEVEDVDPLELTPPLYEVIDPDALEQVFATTPTASRMEGRVIFPYNGHEITVCGDGYVSVQ